MELDLIMEISSQGLVRLTYEALSALLLNHLLSGVDTDCSDDACGRPTELTGFTEWITQTSPTITIGWDWKIEFKDGQGSYERLGQPRSNVMLITDEGRDHSWDQNLKQLGQYVDSVPWPNTVDEAVKSINFI